MNGTDAATPILAPREVDAPGASAVTGEDRTPIFWHTLFTGEQDLLWLPPLLRRQDQLPARTDPIKLIEELSKEEPRQELQPGPSPRLPAWDRWYLRWLLATRVLAATGERDQSIAEAQRLLEEANRLRARRQAQMEERIEQEAQRRSGKQDQLYREEEAFAQAATEAALVCEPSLHSLEHALRERVPTLEEIAGEQQLQPIAAQKSAIGDRALAIAAPVVSGAVLALCLGTLLGLLSLVDLQRNDRGPQLLLAALLGSIPVWLLGDGVERTVQALVLCREPANKVSPSRGKEACMITVITGLLLALVTAEIAVEAIGMRELHSQRVQEARRYGESAALLPMWLYFLLGTLVSGPYLIFKVCKTWGASQLNLRRSWLLHQQRIWREARVGTMPFQTAVLHAHRIGHLKEQLQRTDEMMADLRARHEALEPETTFDEVKSACIQANEVAARAETDAFQKRMEQIVKAGTQAALREGMREQHRA